jgi:phage portal protein BeeE
MAVKVADERREVAVHQALSESALNLEANALFQQVGQELDEFLRKRKMSRSAAAKLFNRPESFIADRIRGRNMTLRSLAELAATLGGEVSISIRFKKAA